MALIEIYVCDFAAVATVPTKGGAAEPIGLFRVQEEDELEGLRQSDVFQLCCRGEGFSDVVPVQRTTESRIGPALEGHEQMFAY